MDKDHPFIKRGLEQFQRERELRSQTGDEAFFEQARKNEPEDHVDVPEHNVATAVQVLETGGCTIDEVCRAYGVTPEQVKEAQSWERGPSGRPLPPTNENDENEEPALTVPADEGEKLNQDDPTVNYRMGTWTRCCQLCDMYQDGPHCSLVEDPIAPGGDCDRYEPAD